MRDRLPREGRGPIWGHRAHVGFSGSFRKEPSPVLSAQLKQARLLGRGGP